MAEGKVGGNTGGAGTAVWKGRIKCQLESSIRSPTQLKAWYWPKQVCNG